MAERATKDQVIHQKPRLHRPQEELSVDCLVATAILVNSVRLAQLQELLIVAYTAPLSAF